LGARKTPVVYQLAGVVGGNASALWMTIHERFRDRGKKVIHVINIKLDQLYHFSTQTQF
jgi:hypothetical protein